MQSLFSQESSLQYVGVLYNDEPYLGSIEELFDPGLFDTIQICTFVSSPKYFFKQTAKYQNIELLLGIEDTTNAEKFMLDTQYTSSFFGSLNKDTLSKIASGAISVRFTKTGTTIHSKIYIQTNTKSSQYRVMIGSANYSYKAFGGQNQFEELLVYDSDYNEKMTSYFLKRYELIKENTLDFVPEHIKKRIASEELKILTLSNEESLDILKSRMDDVQTAIIAPDELAQSIQATKKILAQQEEDTKKELHSIIQTKNIIEIVTKTSKGQTSFIKPAQFAKSKEQIITKILKPTKVIKEFEDSRVKFIYSEVDEHLYFQNSKEAPLTSYPQEASKEVLRDKLKLLEEFISVYTTHTINTEQATQKRIFEAILYAFTSPYIWKLREISMWQQGRDEIKSGFPLFMLIAGMSQSGKTHLMKFISQIMGNHGTYYHYTKQAKLTAMNEANPQIIYSFFNEENLTPIFVDEIMKDYFSSNSSASSAYMGEGFIKKITNAKDGKHPCMIASSNTDFSANSQVMRRIYYIQLNNPFDISKKVEMAELFTTLLNDFGTELYRDFIFRLEHKFKNEITIDMNDILKPGREIFEEYYKMLDIPIPSYFSKSRIDDYYIRGKEMWSDLYYMKFAGFKEDKKNNVILLDDEIVFGTKMSVNRDKQELLQYLPIGILIEQKGIVKLNYEKFFEFIETKSKNVGLLKKIFS